MYMRGEGQPACSSLLIFSPAAVPLRPRQLLTARLLSSDALNAVPVFGRKILESESLESQELGLGIQLTDCLKALLRALKDYVEQYHAAGLTWAPEPKRSANGGAQVAAALSTDTEKTGCACVCAWVGV